MEKEIRKLARLYGVDQNDGKGCRIVENGETRLATKNDIKTILGLKTDEKLEEKSNKK